MAPNPSTFYRSLLPEPGFTEFTADVFADLVQLGFAVIALALVDAGLVGRSDDGDELEFVGRVDAS